MCVLSNLLIANQPFLASLIVLLRDQSRPDKITEVNYMQTVAASILLQQQMSYTDIDLLCFHIFRRYFTLLLLIYQEILKPQLYSSTKTIYAALT